MPAKVDKGVPRVPPFSVAISLCLLTALIARSAAQTPATATLTNGTLKVRVNDPRPLARVIDELEPLCQCSITYEDVRYSAKRDLVQVPAANGGAPTLMPRGGRFEFSYGGIITLVPQRVHGVLAQLLHRYNRSNYPGPFAMVRTGAVFHVLPARPIEGNAAPQPGASLLDTTIHFDSAVRTMVEAFDALKDALIETTGENIVVDIPPHLAEQRRLVVVADWEPARDVLMRILPASRYKLSWRLLHDPGRESYTLKIHRVSEQ